MTFSIENISRYKKIYYKILPISYIQSYASLGNDPMNK